jgi:hypothetical protein
MGQDGVYDSVVFYVVLDTTTKHVKIQRKLASKRKVFKLH